MPPPRVLRPAVAAIGVGALLVSCSPATEHPDTAGLTVLAAASTRVVNDEVTALSDHPLEFVNAGSTTLVQQLAEGAPGDVLVTADEPSMDRAVAAGVVSDPVEVATNSMVMVVPTGNPAGITGVDESLDGANVVLCDPQVPCGTVTEQIMAAEGLEIAAASREHSVSDTLGKVISGEADAGWVYRTDAQAAGDTVEVFDIPGAHTVPNTLFAAVSLESHHPEQARELLALLTGEEMAEVWTDHGFNPVH